MEPAALLTAYDREFRREAVFPDTRREAHEGLVTHTSLVGAAGCVLYAPEEDRLEERVREETEYFESIGQDFDWVFYEHDPQAGALAGILSRRGFLEASPRAVWIRGVQGAGGASPAVMETRRVADRRSAAQAVAVQERIRGRALPDLGLRLREATGNGNRSLAAFVTLINGLPVASGWVALSQGGTFGNLAGGGVLPEHRGRGAYRALLRTRVREAAEQGASHVVAVAGPRNPGGLEQHGFRRLTTARRYRHRVRRPI